MEYSAFGVSGKIFLVMYALGDDQNLCIITGYVRFGKIMYVIATINVSFYNYPFSFFWTNMKTFIMSN